jgi:hypothetical protein
VDEKDQSDVAMEGMVVQFLPEYFRSQRQIIIDTEKLLAEKSKKTDKEFGFTSNEIGYDQKLLRLRYGQYMGEEFESAAGGGSMEEGGDLLTGYMHLHDQEGENEIQVSWVDEERLSASDGDFFMTRSTYKKFSEIYQYSVTNRLIKPDMYTHVGVHVHLLIYQFCKDMGINLVLTEGRGLVEGVIRRPDLRIKKDISVAEGHQSIQKNFILQNKYNLNEIVRKAILFVSTDFSNEERIRELKMQYSNTNEYMCFESSSESIGLQKIKGFERNYNTKFSDITTFIL